MIRSFSLSLVFASSLSMAEAHEFWLSPEAYQLTPGAEMEVRLRVGETFRGASYVYNEARFARFDTVPGGAARAQPQPVEGRLGDDPALSQAAPEDGLVIVVHETEDSRLRYSEWDLFVNFATHKGYPEAVDRHLERGLPREDFVERYRRYAKSLVSVGSGAGADAPVGLRTEIVAGANPYTDDLSGGLPVTVLLEGAPRVGAQVEVFAKDPDGEVEVTTYLTDGSGQATVPVMPGMEYLIDSVVLFEADPETGPDDAVWESLWASLTFQVPGDAR